MKFTTTPSNSTATSAKSKHETVLETVNEVTTIAKRLGFSQVTTDDAEIHDRKMSINGKSLVNFGSCSYLGLENHPKLVNGVINAVTKYGTQFSSSRAYVSVTLYKEAEELLEKMFERPVILGHTVTLAHLSNMPVLVGDRDAVILDMQVHTSVQQPAQMLKNRNVHVEIIRHSRIDQLEERIQELSLTHEKVWYMVDGVYSMFGDVLPIDELYDLLDRYPQFYLYVDDAHGTGWTGRNGAGIMYNRPDLHKKMFLVAGLAKSMAATGGVMVFPDAETRDLVRNCGSTMIFCMPIQPPMLGAIIESVKLHLSPEIKTHQNELKTKIEYFIDTCKQLNIPLIGEFHTPILFVCMGKPQVGYSMVTRLMNKGYYVNLSVFPSVPYKNTGLRIPITANHTFEQIYNLLTTVAEQLPLAMAENGVTMDDIKKAFRNALYKA